MTKKNSSWQNFHHFSFKTLKKSVETRPKVVKLKPKMTKSNEKHRDMMRSPLAPKSPVSTEKVLYLETNLFSS